MQENNLTALISRCHREIREIFLLHQEALILGNFKQALVLFDCYKICHELHKRFEDESLIPMFSGFTDQGQWPVSIYEKEHEKITHWIDKLEQDVNSLVKLKLNKRQERHNIIALIDKERSFKGLTEHHEEREEDGMLLMLDEHCEPDWRQDVILEFSPSWEALLVQQKLIIKNIIDNWE